MQDETNEFNNKHLTRVWPEDNKWNGMKEFRIVCASPSCGWTEKARTLGTAKARAKEHREFPARTQRA